MFWGCFFFSWFLILHLKKKQDCTIHWSLNRLQYYFQSGCWNAKCFIWRATAALMRAARTCCILLIGKGHSRSPLLLAFSYANLELTTCKALYATNAKCKLLSASSADPNAHSLLYQAVLTPLSLCRCCYGELGKCWLLIWCWMRHTLISMSGDLPT